MRRTGSRATIPRSESAPTLAPVWEPSEMGGEDAADGQEAPSAAALRNTFLATQFGSAATASRGIPSTWAGIIERLSSDRLVGPSSFSQVELVAAVEETLRGGPLELQEGLVDNFFTLRKQLSAGPSYKIIECVHRASARNYSLNIISSRGLHRLRVSGPSTSKGTMEPMQAFYWISSFVEEVFSHPNYVAIVLKWGSHDVDSHHQLSVRISDALRLVRELLSPEEARRAYFRLSARELQRLLLRSACLDLYLDLHLYIQ